MRGKQNKNIIIQIIQLKEMQEWGGGNREPLDTSNSFKDEYLS